MKFVRDPWDALRLLFATLITLGWAGSMIAYLFFGKAVDISVVFLTSGVATALFGPSIWKRNGAK